MKTIKEVQDEVRRIGVEVLVHNNVGADRVGQAIIASNQLTVDLAPLIAEADDFQEVSDRFIVMGSETRNDDPGFVRIRLRESDFAAMQAALMHIQERRHR
jgi:hypothetical protein